MDSTTIRYSLFVYIKALYVFYSDKEMKSFIKEVITRIMQSYLKMEHGHPWELIIKYCAFLLIKQKISIYSPEELMMIAEQSVSPATGRILKILLAGKKEYDKIVSGVPLSIEDDCVYMFR